MSGLLSSTGAPSAITRGGRTLEIGTSRLPVRLPSKGLTFSFTVSRLLWLEDHPRPPELRHRVEAWTAFAPIRYPFAIQGTIAFLTRYTPETDVPRPNPPVERCPPFRTSNLNVEFHPGDFDAISTEFLPHVLTDDSRRGVGVLLRQPITVQTMVPSPLKMPAASASDNSPVSSLVRFDPLSPQAPNL